MKSFVFEIDFSLPNHQSMKLLESNRSTTAVIQIFEQRRPQINTHDMQENQNS